MHLSFKSLFGGLVIVVCLCAPSLSLLLPRSMLRTLLGKRVVTSSIEGSIEQARSDHIDNKPMTSARQSPKSFSPTFLMTSMFGNIMPSKPAAFRKVPPKLQTAKLLPQKVPTSFLDQIKQKFGTNTKAVGTLKSGVQKVARQNSKLVKRTVNRMDPVKAKATTAKLMQQAQRRMFLTRVGLTVAVLYLVWTFGVKEMLRNREKEALKPWIEAIDNLDYYEVRKDYTTAEKSIDTSTSDPEAYWWSQPLPAHTITPLFAPNMTAAVQRSLGSEQSPSFLTALRAAWRRFTTNAQRPTDLAQALQGSAFRAQLAEAYLDAAPVGTFPNEVVSVISDALIESDVPPLPQPGMALQIKQLLAAVRVEWLEAPRPAESFARVVNALLVVLIDQAVDSLLHSNMPSETNQAMSAVTNFMKHAEILYTRLIPAHIPVPFVQYQGNAKNIHLEELYYRMAEQETQPESTDLQELRSSLNKWQVVLRITDARMKEQDFQRKLWFRGMSDDDFKNDWNENFNSDADNAVELTEEPTEDDYLLSQIAPKFEPEYSPILDAPMAEEAGATLWTTETEKGKEDDKGKGDLHMEKDGVEASMSAIVDSTDNATGATAADASELVSEDIVSIESTLISTQTEKSPAITETINTNDNADAAVEDEDDDIFGISNSSTNNISLEQHSGTNTESDIVPIVTNTPAEEGNMEAASADLNSSDAKDGILAVDETVIAEELSIGRSDGMSEDDDDFKATVTTADHESEGVIEEADVHVSTTITGSTAHATNDHTTVGTHTPTATSVNSATAVGSEPTITTTTTFTSDNFAILHEVNQTETIDTQPHTIMMEEHMLQSVELINTQTEYVVSKAYVPERSVEETSIGDVIGDVNPTDGAVTVDTIRTKAETELKVPETDTLSFVDATPSASTPAVSESGDVGEISAAAPLTPTLSTETPIPDKKIAMDNTTTAIPETPELVPQDDTKTAPEVNPSDLFDNPFDEIVPSRPASLTQALQGSTFRALVAHALIERIPHGTFPLETATTLSEALLQTELAHMESLTGAELFKQIELAMEKEELTSLQTAEGLVQVATALAVQLVDRALPTLAHISYTSTIEALDTLTEFITRAGKMYVTLVPEEVTVAPIEYTGAAALSRLEDLYYRYTKAAVETSIKNQPRSTINVSDNNNSNNGVSSGVQMSHQQVANLHKLQTVLKVSRQRRAKVEQRVIAETKQSIEGQSYPTSDTNRSTTTSSSTSSSTSTSTSTSHSSHPPPPPHSTTCSSSSMQRNNAHKGTPPHHKPTTTSSSSSGSAGASSTKGTPQPKWGPGMGFGAPKKPLPRPVVHEDEVGGEEVRGAKKLASTGSGPTLTSEQRNQLETMNPEFFEEIQVRLATGRIDLREVLILEKTLGFTVNSAVRSLELAPDTKLRRLHSALGQTHGEVIDIFRKLVALKEAK